jgi:hypothetical protein
MKDYQIYVLHADDRIKSRQDISCEDDETAKKAAEQMVDGHAVELWQQARKVAKFNPHQEARLSWPAAFLQISY